MYYALNNSIDNVFYQYYFARQGAGVEWGNGAEACEANGLSYETAKKCGAVSSAY